MHAEGFFNLVERSEVNFTEVNFITLFDLPQNTNNEKNKTVTQKQMKVARKPKKKP